MHIFVSNKKKKRARIKLLFLYLPTTRRKDFVNLITTMNKKPNLFIRPSTPRSANTPEKNEPAICKLCREPDIRLYGHVLIGESSMARLIICEDREEVYTLVDPQVSHKLEEGDAICFDCIDSLLEKKDVITRVKLQDACCECGRNVKEMAGETVSEEEQRLLTNVHSPISTVIKSWAHIEGKRTFSYGLSGTFEFVNLSKDLQPGCVMCRFCMNKHEYVPYLCVSCDHCHKNYQGCMRLTDVENGFGCAANVEPYGICCGYGSKYDDQVLRFTDPSDVQSHRLQLGHRICDDCISTLIDHGVCFLPDSQA